MKHLPLKAIFFDIDDTLYPTASFASKARKSALGAMIELGLKGEPQQLYEELLEIVDEFTPNFGHHFEKLLDRLPLSSYEGLNRSILIAGAVVAYHESKVRELELWEDGKRLLQKLSGQDLILGLITSGLAIKQAEKIIRLGLMQYIPHRAIFISDQLGINKPNPKLYQKALNTFLLKAPEALYVGDNPSKDVAPAKKVGMWTAWMVRSGRHRNEIPEVPPDYRVENFEELSEILKTDFGIPL